MATLRLITAKRTLGFKLESAANQYTNNETLTATDYAFSAYEVSYGPEIESYMRKLARGDYSRDTAVSGRRSGTVTFKVDLHEGNGVDQAPMYFQMLQACAMKQSANAGTGVWVTTHADLDRKPATIEVIEMQEGDAPKQLRVRFYGCMGTVRVTNPQVGQPVTLEFTFTGALGVIDTRSFGNRITPTSFDTAVPDAVLSATINLFGTTQFIGNFAVDLANQVENFTDPTKAAGFDGARVVDRTPTLELDPDTLVTDDIDLYTNQITNTTGALSITIGSKMIISAPAAQLETSYAPGDREGHVSQTLRLGLKRSSGNDEFEILQGSKT